MSSGAESTAVRPPKQDRSRRTLERIVTACLEILDEEGPTGITVQAVVKRARSSVGSFYARFDGKDDLLDYLGERVWVDALERWQEALRSRDWDELDLAGVVAVAVDLLHDVAKSRSASLRALDRAPRRPDRGGAYADFLEHVHGGLAELLISKSDHILRPDPARAVRVALLGATGVIDGALSETEGESDKEAVTADALDLMLAYLAGDGRSTDPGEVEYFDVWG